MTVGSCAGAALPPRRPARGERAVRAKARAGLPGLKRGCQVSTALAYGWRRSSGRLGRRGREAEGDGLLNRYRGNPIVGSNPTVSAKLLFRNKNHPLKAPENPIISEGFATDIPTSETARAPIFGLKRRFVSGGLNLALSGLD